MEIERPPSTREIFVFVSFFLVSVFANRGLINYVKIYSDVHHKIGIKKCLYIFSRTEAVLLLKFDTTFIFNAFV